MSDLPVMGTLDKPVRLDPFQRIIEVGWGGGVAIVEVTAPEIKFYQVQVLDPAEWFDNSFGGSTITPDDYKEEFVLSLGGGFGVGTVVVEDALDDIWLWDGFFTGEAGDEPFNSSQVAAGTATFGYAPPIHLIGEQVELAHFNPPFGRVALGDVVDHTHPNGTTARYRSGYTAITHGPAWIDDGEGNDIQIGDDDFSDTESWYWRRVTTRPQSTAAILRKSFLVNFRTSFAKLAELEDFPITLDSPLDWSIKGYRSGTGFNIADGRATPIGGVLPKFGAEGSVAGAHSGSIRKFR